jgi:hypothetical protein
MEMAAMWSEGWILVIKLSPYHPEISIAAPRGVLALPHLAGQNATDVAPLATDRREWGYR